MAILSFIEFISESKRPPNYPSLDKLKTKFSSMKDGRKINMNLDDADNKIIRGEFISFDGNKITYKLIPAGKSRPEDRERKVSLHRIIDVKGK